MIKNNMIRKHYLIDINIKIYHISMLILFKFNYIPYELEKVFLD